MFLTKNGRGRYAVMEMEEYREYERLKAIHQLAAELERGRRSGEEEGRLALEEVDRELDIHHS